MALSMDLRARSEVSKGIIEAARRGDDWAQSELLRLLQVFARHLCRDQGGGRGPEWQDVAQEACWRLYAGSIESFRAGGPERSYLYSVVKATRIQMVRSQVRRETREGKADVKPQAAQNAERRTLLYRLLNRISRDCQDLLERIFFDGETTAEVAAALGLAESSVRAKQSRCLERARQHLP